MSHVHWKHTKIHKKSIFLYKNTHFGLTESLQKKKEGKYAFKSKMSRESHTPKFELLHCILMSVAVRNSTESEYKAGNL